MVKKMETKKEKGSMEAIWGEMEKLYGDDGLADIEQVAALSSGSLALDDVLGIWGNPMGRIIQFAGRESSGKTLMSFMTIKEWQSRDPKNWALFIDAECTFDKDWAESLGVDVSDDRLRMLKTNDGAKIFEMLCGVPHKEIGKPKVKPGLLDIVKNMGGAEKSGLGVIILDSVAAIAPPLEMSSKSGKSNMALMARFLPPELRKITPMLSETGVMFIAINQVRINPGQMFGNPEGTPGGSAWKHHCSVMVNFTKSMAKDKQILDDNGEPIGHIVMARIDKNKVAAPMKSCEFRVQYLNGVVDRHIEVGDLAIKYGVVTRPNNRTYEYGEEKYSGKDNFYDAIRDNKLEEEMLEKIKEAKESVRTQGPLVISKVQDDEDSGWDEILQETEEE